MYTLKIDDTVFSEYKIFVELELKESAYAPSNKFQLVNTFIEYLAKNGLGKTEFNNVPSAINHIEQIFERHSDLAIFLTSTNVEFMLWATKHSEKLFYTNLYIEIDDNIIQLKAEVYDE